MSRPAVLQKAQLWSVVATAVPGRSHVRDARPCQDRFAWSWSDRGVLTTAVADGAGSAPLARAGADAAVHAVDSTSRRLGSYPQPPVTMTPAMFTGLFGVARTSLRYRAWRLNVPIGDLATTLAVAVLGPRHLLLGQVGDGLLTVRLTSGELVAPVPPGRGEYANETYSSPTPSGPHT